MTGPDQSQSEPGPDAGLEDLQADIEKTRADLGKTAQALTDKFDVKARVGDAVVDHARPTAAIGIAVAVAAAILGILIWRRRTR